MKKIKIALSNSDKLYSFNIPGFGEFKNNRSRFLEIIDTIQTALIYMFFLFLPVHFWVFNESSLETSIFKYLLAGITIISGFYLAGVALGGTKRIIDSDNFFNILIFAFISTLSLSAISILGSSDSSSSFGTVGISALKGISGVALITFLGIFYYINALLKDNSSVIKALRYLGFGFVLLILHTTTKGNSATFITYFSIATILFMGLSLIERSIMSFINFFLALFIGIHLLDKFAASGMIIVLVAVLVTWIILFLITFTNYRNFIYSKFKIGKDKAYSLAKAFNDLTLNTKDMVIASDYLFKVIFFLTPIGLASVLIFVLTSYDQNLEFISNSFTSFKDTAELLLDKGFQDFLFGLGISSVSRVSGIFAVVIFAQGLLGVLAYLYFYGLGLFTIAKNFSKFVGNKVFSKEMFLFLTLAALFIFVLVLNIFEYVGMFTLAFGFLMFSLLNVLISGGGNITKNNEIIDFFSNRLGKRSPVVQSILALTFIVLSIILIAMYNNLTGDLI